MIALIKDRMERTDKDNMVTWGSLKERCLEGKPAYMQAIQYLEKLEPISPLQSNKCLCLAASDLVYDCIASNTNSYTTSDGCETCERIARRAGVNFVDATEAQQFISMNMGPDFAKQAVLSMIIDEGLPNRDRCKLLTSKNYRYVGCAMYKNPAKGYVCVLTLCTTNT